MRLRLDRIARPFVAFSERYYPDPFVFAIALTGVTFGMAVVATPTTAAEAIALWGNGLTGFLGFAMQICIVLVCAHALAHTDAVQRGIDAVAGWPRSEAQAYALITTMAGRVPMAIQHRMLTTIAAMSSASSSSLTLSLAVFP